MPQPKALSSLSVFHPGSREGVSGYGLEFRAFRAEGLELRAYLAPKVCKMMASMAVIGGLGLLFHILLGFGQGAESRVGS